MRHLEAPAASSRAPGPNEWQPDSRPPLGGRSPRALLLPLGLVVAAGFGAVSFIVSDRFEHGLVALVLAASAGATVAWAAGQGRRTLRALPARPLEPGDEPRLENVTRALTTEVAVSAPQLWLVDAAAPNALVTYVRGRPTIAVSTGLVQSYTRTELEAVVAHCLVKLKSAGVLESALTWLAEAPSYRWNGFYDLEAVAITRYPPALASAIRKAQPSGGRSHASWFAGEEPEPSPRQRIDALLDL